MLRHRESSWLLAGGWESDQFLKPPAKLVACDFSIRVTSNQFSDIEMVIALAIYYIV